MNTVAHSSLLSHQNAITVTVFSVAFYLFRIRHSRNRVAGLCHFGFLNVYLISDQKSVEKEGEEEGNICHLRRHLTNGLLEWPPSSSPLNWDARVTFRGRKETFDAWFKSGKHFTLQVDERV